MFKTPQKDEVLSEFTVSIFGLDNKNRLTLVIQMKAIDRPQFNDQAHLFLFYFLQHNLPNM